MYRKSLTARLICKSVKVRYLLNFSIVIWPLCVVIVFAVILCTQTASADGKYFPLVEAYKTLPVIPSQRAILTYKDGVEKLIIESALNGEGKEFGWIIPLPAEPSEFKEVSPGLIKTLSLAIQPRITHDLFRIIGALSSFVFIFGFWCLWILIRKPKKPLYSLLLIIFIVFLYNTLFQTMSAVGVSFTQIAGVKVKDVQQIGSYELAVLNADNSDALDKWLSDNSFIGLTDKDKVIVSDYIRNGWCFVAAKLRRENEGYSTPHPISISFTSDKVIYPIRLTSTVGNAVYMELFVIANEKAECERVSLEVSDEYNFESEAHWRGFGEKHVAGFIGQTYRQEIGHPGAKEYMWDGCVLNKLCGTLLPSEMDEDIVLELKTWKPYRKHYYSHQGAIGMGLVVCLISWCILLIILTLVFYRGIEKENGRKFYFLRIIIPVTLFSLLLLIITYAVVPKVDVKTNRGILEFLEINRIFGKMQIFAEENEFFDGVSKDEVAKKVADYLRIEDTKNAYTQEKIKSEDSPGNYNIFEDERGIVFRIYSMEGYPEEFVLTANSRDDVQ